MNKEVMKQALDALNESGLRWPNIVEAIKALEEALKQEQGEPWGTYMGHRLTPYGTKEFWGFANAPLTEGTKLYTKPQKRTWIGLLDDEKEHIEISGGKADLTLAEKIEAILKERNT